MNSQRIVGVVLLIIGVALLVAGLHASHSMADRTHDLIFGRYTKMTALYIFGGIALGIAGLLMAIFSSRRT